MGDHKAGIIGRHRVSILGSGETTLVLGPGLGTDQASWRHVAAAFAPHYRIVLFDLIGASPDMAEHYDHVHYGRLDAYAADLLEILKATGTRPCRYVGHSVSGMVGILASVAAPELFSQLVLIGASPCYLNKPGYRGGFDTTDLDGLFRALSDDYLAWSYRMAQTMVGRPRLDPAVEEFARGLGSLRPDVALSVVTTIFQIDYRDMLRRVTVPTTVIQTRRDAAATLEAAEFLRDHIPGAVLDVIPAEGHLPHLTAPEEIVDALRRHLR